MKYFAFGSNMNAKRMGVRGVEFSGRKRAILEGWRLEFNTTVDPENHKEGYANIVTDKKGIVEGILYKIQNDGLENLDRYEEYPDHYKRIKVKVRLDNGKRVQATIYIAQPSKIRAGLKPSKKYLKHLLKGRDLLSKKYYEMLRRWPTLD